MTINFALIIQMIHFFIGYLIIKNLLLNPAFKKIQNDEKKENELNSFIKSEQIIITEKESRKNLIWQQILIKINNLKPDIEKFQKILIFWNLPNIKIISTVES